MQQASARCCGALSECRSRTTQETDARAPPVISDHGSAAAHLFGYRRSFGCKASPPPRRCWYIILASASRSAGTDISNMCRTPERTRSKLGDQDRLDYRHKPVLLFKNSYRACVAGVLRQCRRVQVWRELSLLSTGKKQNKSPQYTPDVKRKSMFAKRYQSESRSRTYE